LEALVRLAPVEFTRAEATNEAGLQKPSANRALDKLENDGFIVRTSSQRPVRYRVNEDNPLFRMVAIANAFSENVLSDPGDRRATAQGLAAASRALKRLLPEARGQAARSSTAAQGGVRRSPGAPRFSHKG